MPTTSADIDARIAGQTLATRFLDNLENNADVTVVRWKDAAGEWQGWTLGERVTVSSGEREVVLRIGAFVDFQAV